MTDLESLIERLADRERRGRIHAAEVRAYLGFIDLLDDCKRRGVFQRLLDEEIAIGELDVGLIGDSISILTRLLTAANQTAEMACADVEDLTSKLEHQTMQLAIVTAKVESLKGQGGQHGAIA